MLTRLYVQKTHRRGAPTSCRQSAELKSITHARSRKQRRKTDALMSPVSFPGRVSYTELWCDILLLSFEQNLMKDRR